MAPIHNFLYGTAALVVDDATESETQEEERSLILKGVPKKEKPDLIWPFGSQPKTLRLKFGSFFA